MSKRIDDRGLERGQVLPIAVIFMTALLLVAGLAVDVTAVLSAERFYTATADAAALAAGQDLQQAKTRLITSADRTRARGHAIDVLVDRLGATGYPSDPTCVGTSDLIDCALPGTPYLVSVRTPSPVCVECEPERSVQVSIRNPAYGLTFARLAGQDEWTVEASAVAGLQFTGRYAVHTLRPPDPLPNESDQNRENISVDGTNTWVQVPTGDVGTNTSAYTNSGGRISLGTGYRIEHIDDITPDPWNQINGLPEGKLLHKLIQDPDYPYADFSGAPEYAHQEDGRWDAVAGHGSPCPDPGSDGFPSSWGSVLQDPTLDIVCYLPGVYDDQQGFTVSQNTEVAYLLPGAYYFARKGLSVGGRLMGGLVSGQPGVILKFPQDTDLAGNNSVAIILNQGDEDCADNACRATAAFDFAGHQMVSPEGLLLTVQVERDGSCFSGTKPLNVAKCSTSNNTVNLPGNGNLSVWGIVYAPSDNIQVNGDNTSQVGEVGQLVSWTVKYSGGAKLIQNYPVPDQVGVVRLDAACTGTEACG